MAGKVANSGRCKDEALYAVATPARKLSTFLIHMIACFVPAPFQKQNAAVKSQWAWAYVGNIWRGYTENVQKEP